MRKVPDDQQVTRLTVDNNHLGTSSYFVLVGTYLALLMSPTAPPSSVNVVGLWFMLVLVVNYGC